MKLITIDDLDLSVRAYNSLKLSGINTLKQIKNLTDEDIRALKSINRKAFAEIKKMAGSDVSA